MVAPTTSSATCPICACRLIDNPAATGTVRTCPSCQPKLFAVPVRDWRDK